MFYHANPTHQVSVCNIAIVDTYANDVQNRAITKAPYCSKSCQDLAWRSHAFKDPASLRVRSSNIILIQLTLHTQSQSAFKILPLCERWLFTSMHSCVHSSGVTSSSRAERLLIDSYGI
jgi:hypothetical protein